MAQLTVGTRELKSKLSEYMRRVKAGQIVIVTERGTAIGVITPMGTTREARMQALADSGFLEWGGNNKLKSYRAKIVNKSNRLISDIVIEDRR